MFSSAYCTHNFNPNAIWQIFNRMATNALCLKIVSPVDDYDSPKKSEKLPNAHCNLICRAHNWIMAATTMTVYDIFSPCISIVQRTELWNEIFFHKFWFQIIIHIFFMDISNLTCALCSFDIFLFCFHCVAATLSKRSKSHGRRNEHPPFFGALTSGMRIK